jgi:hypothetical protein
MANDIIFDGVMSCWFRVRVARSLSFLVLSKAAAISSFSFSFLLWRYGYGPVVGGLMDGFFSLDDGDGDGTRDPPRPRPSIDFFHTEFQSWNTRKLAMG